jgi:16S rRNA (guanine(966)-N(2))-methyltransferase RsmD
MGLIKSPQNLPHQVRIIGGVWRSRQLKVISQSGLRPSTDRLRETVFNWLGQDLSGLRCLDLFAGSGALGFEAASRNASVVQLIEKDKIAFLKELPVALSPASQTSRVQRICFECMRRLTRLIPFMISVRIGSVAHLKVMPMPSCSGGKESALNEL